MTHREKIIVSAYTGYLMCDFSDVHKYIEEKLGRPVWTHEMADPKIQSEIYNATREDFLALCRDGAESAKKNICDNCADKDICALAKLSSDNTPITSCPGYREEGIEE